MTTPEEDRLTHFDPSQLSKRYRGKIEPREVHRVDAINVARTITSFLSKRPTFNEAPFTVTWMITVHEKMFGDLWIYGGKIRHENLNLGVDCRQIRQQLMNLSKDIHAWRAAGDDELSQVARFHSELVRIHPFKDGNGRWARLLCDIYSIYHFAWITEWPVVDGASTSPIRNEYIDAIKQSIEFGDLQKLINLHATYKESKLFIKSKSSQS
jgi:fido (protein-threonine AMPylation protein)